MSAEIRRLLEDARDLIADGVCARSTRRDWLNDCAVILSKLPPAGSPPVEALVEHDWSFMHELETATMARFSLSDKDGETYSLELRGRSLEQMRTQLEAALKGAPLVRQGQLVEQRVTGHGEGQEHAIADAQRILRGVRDTLTALDEPEDYWRRELRDRLNEILAASPSVVSAPPKE